MFKHKMIQKMIGSDAISATADGFCLSAAVAIDRLVHHSVVLELNIESYRMEVAKKNKSKKPDGPAKGSK
jgi:DNA replication protein DnaC